MSASSAGGEAVDQFVARVLRSAHEIAEAHEEPSESRAILHVARLFADELTARHPGFDRREFVTAATAHAQGVGR